jgi:hypothetical protein
MLCLLDRHKSGSCSSSWWRMDRAIARAFRACRASRSLNGRHKSQETSTLFALAYSQSFRLLASIFFVVCRDYSRLSYWADLHCPNELTALIYNTVPLYRIESKSKSNMLRRSHPLIQETMDPTPSSTSSPIPPQDHTTTRTHPLRRRVKAKSALSWSWGSNSSTFKLVVVIETLFLLFSWFFFSDRLLSSRLWSTQHLKNGRSSHLEDARSSKWNTQPQRGSLQVNGETFLRPILVQEEPVIVEIPDKYKGPTLIIGGSDGSGTRAFAQFVRRLGVPMQIDDQETMDVHGSVMFQGAGWPPLVNLILNATHSANYELEDLSDNNTLLVTTAREEIKKLKNTLDAFESRFYSKYPNVSRATGVSVGFKAPITMTLLPLLKDAFGRIKYIHVVRDGRDVSLSTNASPVQKFYKTMYPNDVKERMAKYAFNNSLYSPVLAVHLWNDWNLQALEWEKMHSSSDSDGDFDYLVMRSEDLLGDPVKKYESLVRLAEFVKSPMTPQELCCMSREKTVDMGQSLRSNERYAGDYRKGGVTRRQWNLASSATTRSHLGGRRREEVKARVKAKVANNRAAGRTKEEQPKDKDEHLDDEGLDDDDDDNDEEEEEEDDDDHDKQELISEYRKRITDLGKFAEDGHLEQKREMKSAFADFKHFSLIHKLGHPSTRAAAAPDESPQVQKRYGKWKEMLKDHADLSALLHKEGAKGLATFGYEPQTNFYDNRPSPTNIEHDYPACDETVICNDNEKYEGISLQSLFFTDGVKAD